MSAFAGILRFDGGAVDRVTLERMGERMALRGYDTTLHVDGACGVLGGRAGVVLQEADLLIAFDGRLDNRDELLPHLQLTEAAPDAAIVAAAFRAWGGGCITRLDGDFAIAIVDLRARRVLCARDRFAVRTLFYRIDPAWVAFATSIDSLTAGIEPMPDVNEGMAAEYLSSFIVSVHDTLFVNVYRVPPSHHAAITPGRHELSEYWTPSPSPLHCSRDEEYDERLRELLRSAVTTRLRGSAVAGIMLSGGLDSSAVTGMAVEVVRGGGVSTASIETFAGSVPGHDDERSYADAVSSRWGLTAHVIQERRPAHGLFASEIQLDLEPQMFPHSPTVDGIRELARTRDIRVMLTGNGADDWFGSGPGAYADLFAQGRLIALARRLHSDAGTDLFAGWRLALQGIFWPLLPEAVRDGVRGVLRRGQAPPWIDRRFAGRVSLEERLARFRGRRMFATRELDDNWFQSMHGIRVHTSEIVTRGGDRFGLELAHPFFDRRIVEFGLALPSAQLWQDGQTKVLLRRAMRDYLPDAVAARRSSPSADHAFLHAIAAEAGERPFADLECERRGWIDGSEVRRMWSTLRADPARAAYLGRILWGILAVELWLHARTMVKYPLSPGRSTRA